MMRILIIIFLCLTLPSCAQDSSETNANSVSNVDRYQKDIDALSPNPKVCSNTNNEINWEALNSATCNWLSDYNLFSGSPMSASSIQEPGILYEINSALFTDYAKKHRFIIFPNGSSALYKEDDVFEFPTGTVLIKVFSLPVDHSNAEESQIIEIRLQIRRPHGWVFIPYVWHPQSQDAYKHLIGKTIEHSFAHRGEITTFDYHIPSASTCQQCHQNNNRFLPIGLKARHLNKNIAINSAFSNQLMQWQSLGLLRGLPAAIETIDTAPNWKDTTKSLNDRAKAYLDINCAHCHSDGGTAALSGLRLEYWRKELDYAHGVCNSSHGWRGGGFDIWPGEGTESSITRRMGMTAAKDRMPPIGRSLVDDDAVDLMREWIDAMPYIDCGG